MSKECPGLLKIGHALKSVGHVSGKCPKSVGVRHGYDTDTLLSQKWPCFLGEQYQRLVGKLIYLSHTRPDIAFAVSMVSQFMHSPGAEHVEAVYKILRYLKGTPGRGLLFKKHGHLQVEEYTDADWAGSVTDRRSTSGYCSFVGGNLVTWRSKTRMW
mgnify:CR=1 FL=1